jgi:hypothetical protein
MKTNTQTAPIFDEALSERGIKYNAATESYRITPTHITPNATTDDTTNLEVARQMRDAYEKFYGYNFGA